MVLPLSLCFLIILSPLLPCSTSPTASQGNVSFPNDLSPLLLSLVFFLTKAAVVLAETVNKISPGTLDLEQVWGQAFGALGRTWQVEAGGGASLWLKHCGPFLVRMGTRVWHGDSGGKELFAIALICSRGQPRVWPRSSGALHDTIRYHVCGPSWKTGQFIL